MKALPDQALLLEMFVYEADTGKLYRKKLTADCFSKTTDPRGAEWVAAFYNARNAGKEAFTASDPRGYKHGKVLGVKYQAHRIIWKMVHGSDPEQVDHINGNQSDNRIANLRAATNAENSRNYSKPSGASSVYRGVFWVKRDKVWAARISAGKLGKISLGNFKNERQAAEAYDAAAIKYHGEFATLNFPEARILAALEGGEA